MGRGERDFSGGVVGGGGVVVVVVDEVVVVEVNAYKCQSGLYILFLEYSIKPLFNTPQRSS